MAKDRVLDIGVEQFRKYGFMKLQDTTAAPTGSLRVMRNAQVTTRGGLAPRPGTLLLGSSNASAHAVKGFYNFRKSLGADELLVKVYDTKIEYLSKDYESVGWTLLKGGFTADSEFGFATSLVNTDNQDYLVGSNRYEPYFLWTGAVAQLAVTLAGGELVVTVDSTLLPDIYYSGAATSSSATTLDVATATWAASQWVNFYVHITSGALTGKVRKITANTSTQITFDTLGSDPGLCTFEIRMLAFPASGTLVYNSTEVAYTAVDTDATFTVASAAAATSGVLVSVKPIEYPAAPRGNRIANYLTRLVVGNVRSALTRGSGGALQGYASSGTAFVSKLNNPADFSYAATRIAGEGDSISMPYGGGDITDVQTQEDSFYVFKGRYIESIQYSQDTNDLAVRDPLKAGFGSLGKTIKGPDDIYFWTADKQITSLGRVRLKDVKPQTLNIGNPISRFLEDCGADSDVGRGMQISNKLYFPLKSTPGLSANDILLVLNKDTGAFEGIWDIPAFAIEFWNDDYFYAESNGPDVYKMFHEHADVRGDDRFAIEFEVATNWMNLTASKSYIQAFSGIVVEGYIAGGAVFTTSIFSEFGDTPFCTFDFAFTEEGFLDGEASQAFLAGAPFAINPEAAVYGDPDEDGRRHFMFHTYVPFQYANYFSVGFSSNEVDDDFEITRFGLILKEDPAVNMNRIKYI